MLQQLFTIREGRLLGQLLAAMKPANSGQQVGAACVAAWLTWLELPRDSWAAGRSDLGLCLRRSFETMEAAGMLRHAATWLA